MRNTGIPVRVVRRAMLGALLAVLAFPTIGVAAANADDAPIELSSDGVIWSTSLPGGLFDSFQGAVPGDTVTKSVSVRNPTDFSITMKTLAHDVTSPSANLLSSITVDGEAGGRTLPAPVPLSALADCATLAPDVVLAAHAITRVSITLAMSDVRGAMAQNSTGGFNILITMQDNAAGTPTPSCGGSIPGGGGGGGGGSSGGGGHTGGTGTSHSHPTAGSPTINVLGVPLAFTGESLEGPLFLGGALLALGFLLLLARRRRKDRKDA